jgi:hypothetical protein
MSKPKQETTVHIFVPDTQIEPGRPTQMVEWAGQYIKDEYSGCQDLKIIVAGDWWNMGSLSSYDKRGGHAMEGRRYVKDVDSGNDAWDRFNERCADVEADRHFLFGNHEQRILRVIDDDASQEGLVGYHHLAVEQWDGWQTHQFLAPVTIDGVTYSHYFVNPRTGQQIGGSITNQLNKLKHSFVKGHTQGFMYDRCDTIRGGIIGISAGSFYIHDEDYLTPQVTNYWRGLVVLHNVRGGDADLMQVSLDYLCRRYEGKSLSALKWRK